MSEKNIVEFIPVADLLKGSQQGPTCPISAFQVAALIGPTLYREQCVILKRRAIAKEIITIQIKEGIVADITPMKMPTGEDAYFLTIGRPNKESGLVDSGSTAWVIGIRLNIV